MAHSAVWSCFLIQQQNKNSKWSMEESLALVLNNWYFCYAFYLSLSWLCLFWKNHWNGKGWVFWLSVAKNCKWVQSLMQFIFVYDADSLCLFPGPLLYQSLKELKPWSTEGLDIRGWVNGPKWRNCWMIVTLTSLSSEMSLRWPPRYTDTHLFMSWIR